MSLYDAMQVYQMRSNHDEALRHGELAIRYLEKSGRQNQSPSAAYLLGRTYFRMGAVYANSRKDHRTAVSWFEKAVPLLGKSPPQEAMPDLGRLGDSFVSMGVSYWNAGYRKKAVALTEHGANLIEEAVRRGSHDRSVLVVPYSNLAAMQREMGNTAGANHMQELAEKAKGADPAVTMHWPVPRLRLGLRYAQLAENFPDSLSNTRSPRPRETTEKVLREHNT